MPPIRKPQEASIATGVGSAKGVRWRGELAGVGETAKKPATTDPSFGEMEPPVGDDEDPNVRDQVTREAPSWLVSMVIHLILLLILAFISTPAGNSIGTLMLSIGQGIRDSPVEFAEFEISTADSPNDSEVLEDVESDVDLDALFEAANLNTVEDVVPVQIGEGALELVQPMFNGRSGAIKAALLARFGGTIKTQEAVKLGLEWLKRNQTKNGSWSMRGPFNDRGFTENKAAATAMALLAFLGDGHTHKKGDYQEVVERGIKWLVSQQDREGFFANDSRSHEQMYAQAQATIAICELYGMSGDSWLRPHAQRAIDFAEKAQSDAGGWRYERNFDSDTSMTGWYVMALESGRSAKLEVNISVLSRVMLYLDDAASYDGAAYGYQARSAPSAAMTAEGLLCRQYIGWKRDHPPMLRGITALLEDTPFNIADQDVYYWYYATQVLHHYGGAPWRAWNDVMKVELPLAQVKTGRESGSWAPQRDRWGKNSGRLYTTCLSLYCLEVYYRHMPLYNTEASKEGAGK
ncbi:terpene cyclase/mutase family protein [bacterium]|nr:terpene cyclase/mutase family protein [bacterium]